MRTLGALATHLAGDAHTLATMLRLDLQDGTSLGITDHDQSITYVGLAYSAGTGILPSDVVLTIGLDADNFEVTGPIGPTVTRAAVIGGRYTRARAKLFLVNWASLTAQAAIMAGKVADARVEGGRFIFEVRSASDAFNQVIGRTLSPYCSADFGDSLCKMAREPYPATVTAVSSRFGFTVDVGGDHADDFFNLGTVSFLTGSLAGTAEVEVFDYIGSSGVVELFTPLAEPPEVGATLNLYRGCSRLRKSDDASLPTCLSYDNVINFRGFPEVPGSDLYLKIAEPGAAGA